MAAKLRSRLLVPHQRDSAIGHEASAAINDVFQGRVILDLKDKKFDKGSILYPPFLRCSRCIGWFYNGRLQSFQVAYNHLEVFSMDEQVREALLADGVRRESISPYVRAWRWAESGKPSAGLAGLTIRQYELDSQRVYRLLGKSTNKQ